jgi:hypothetical protein
VNVRGAAELTGLSVKAIQRRIERGTLASVLDANGHRRIPRTELTGLIGTEAEGTSITDLETVELLLTEARKAGREEGMRLLTEGKHERELELTREIHERESKVVELTAKAEGNQKRLEELTATLADTERLLKLAEATMSKRQRRRLEKSLTDST